MRVWKILFILCAACLLALAAPAQQPTLFAGAEEAIMRADALGATRNFTGAIDILKRSLTKFPTYERLYLSLAYWQEARGVFDIGGTLPPNAVLDTRKLYFRTNLIAYPELARELFETYGQAMMNVQDARYTPRFASNLIVQDFPLELGQYGPLALPGDPTFYTYSLSDMQLPTERRGVRQCLITTKPWVLSPFRDVDDQDVYGYTKDPKYGQNPNLLNDPRFGGWTFNRMIAAYELDPERKLWMLRFRIMWQDVPGRSAARRQLARNTAELLLRLSGLVRAYTGYGPRFASNGVMNVWLAEKGQAGGEALDDNIYLQEVGTPRSDAEWVRELAHEYGHSTLPVVGGYTRPEWGANGRLGERLFLRWLLENPSQPENHPWLRALNAGELKETRVDAPIKLFANLGPDAPKMRDTDSTAMDAFVGMALYLEQTQGSDALRYMLSGLKSPQYGSGDRDGGFREMAEVWQTFQQSTTQPFIILRANDLPANIPYWVYLTAGTWQIELDARDDAPMQVKVEADGVACKANAPDSYTTQPFLKPGWHRIRISPEGIIMPSLTTVKLVKQ